MFARSLSVIGQAKRDPSNHLGLDFIYVCIRTCVSDMHAHVSVLR